MWRKNQISFFQYGSQVDVYNLFFKNYPFPLHFSTNFVTSDMNTHSSISEFSDKR